MPVCPTSMGHKTTDGLGMRRGRPRLDQTKFKAPNSFFKRKKIIANTVLLTAVVSGKIVKDYEY